MKIEIINKIRVATPETDMWLCNEEQKIISNKVFLGINASETDWKDITEEEKMNFENLWNDENLTENTLDEKATESDYINALEELGVSFNE